MEPFWRTKEENERSRLLDSNVDSETAVADFVTTTKTLPLECGWDCTDRKWENVGLCPTDSTSIIIIIVDNERRKL
jgi:hypothetical protein